eukprot:9363682-Pyramimonas_sp.AAC.1
MLTRVRSAMRAYDLARTSRASNCSWVLGIWWLSGCSTDIARDVPTHAALNRMTARFWKLGILKPAVSAS